MHEVLILMVLAISSIFFAWGIDEAIFDVVDYGAISDGHTDNSQAFLDAWKATCNASVELSTLYVPPEEATFLVSPTIFSGPCNASKTYFSILGKIIAPNLTGVWDGRDASEWLVFNEINGLHVDGYGSIDGQGKAWWDQSCRYHPQLKNCTKLAPTMFKFLKCNNTNISDIKIINSSQTHLLVENCNLFKIHNVTVDSPRDSPNTDGVHIQSSHHVSITNSTIASGDDCISIGDFISDLNVNHIQCSFGHGISIGSLGRSGNFVHVKNIKITDCIFNETTNGARIKTWQVGKGYLKHVKFERLTFNNVKNPIIIDQNYCDVRGKCPSKETGVQISNVSYLHTVGTSETEIAININCSKSVPCHGIKMEGIELKSAVNGRKVTASCSNAYGEEDGVEPGPCLLHEGAQRKRTWNIIMHYVFDLF